jgi:hypothetical protein
LSLFRLNPDQPEVILSSVPARGSENLRQIRDSTTREWGGVESLFPIFFLRVRSRLRQDAQQPALNFVHFDESGAPAPPLDVSLDFFQLPGGCPAGFKQAQERLLGAHRHPLGNKGPAISSQAVDAPAGAVLEVEQDAH